MIGDGRTGLSVIATPISEIAPMRNLGERMVALAFAAVLAALLLSFAWSIVRPLLPVLAVIGLVLLLATLSLRHRRGY